MTIKRYKVSEEETMAWGEERTQGCMWEDENGDYVKYSDYLALQAQVEQLREVLRYADNKLYILTHNRKDVSSRLLTDADKGYKAVHEAVLGLKDNLNVFVAKRDAEIKAQAVADAVNAHPEKIAYIEHYGQTRSRGDYCDLWLSSSDLIQYANQLRQAAKEMT